MGAVLDSFGWADLQEVVRGLCAAGHAIDANRLQVIVTTGDKRRFELSRDGTRIRAVHGHSIAVELDLPNVAPPEVLFHGTVPTALASILESGIDPRRRRMVHLSEAETLAREVGARRGDPVVLRVAAAQMHAEGHPFYRSSSGVWLTRAVPPEYLTQGTRG
ncbi:MAG: RNA 2'-phosphotransferase [Planctomycetota bacterium]